MGLINKLKNILFEEEEVEIPVIEKKEKPVIKESKELPKIEKEPPKSSFYDDLKPQEPVIKSAEMPKKEEVKVSRSSEVNYSDRELFKNEKTFNFPAFDEEEFARVAKPQPQTSKPPLFSREKAKIEKEPPKKEEPPKKFRPSPIISPVYGILDKNYTPEDITSKTESQNIRLDVETVRKKAFGDLPKTNQTTTFKEEVKISNNDDERILEERLEKMRTIDELLNDSSDEIIDLEDSSPNIEEEVITPKSLDEPLRAKHKEEKEELKEEESQIEDDTLESDLFDLIDSMYENREDEE